MRNTPLFRRTAAVIAVCGVVAAGVVVLSQDDDSGKKSSSDKSTQSPAPQPTLAKVTVASTVQDPKAKVSYGLPAGWSAQDPSQNLGFFTSVAGVEKKPNAPGAPTAMYTVGLLDSKMFAAAQTDPRAAAQQLVKQFAEFFYPNEASDVVLRDEAGKVDGRDAWLTEIRVEPKNTADQKMLMRGTVITDGERRIYTFSVAQPAETTNPHVYELEAIAASLKFT
jgi:hypothetical protein